MPVSSPSYFPPNSSTDQVKGINAGQLATGSPLFLAGKNAGQNSTTGSLIIIGDQSGEGGLTQAAHAGTIIIGDSTAPVWNNIGSTTNSPGACILIGQGSFQLVTHMDSTIAIGQGIAPSATGQNFTGNVLIGNGIAAAASNNSISTSVIVGHGALAAVNTLSSTSNNVILGYDAVANAAGNASMSDSVFIGYKVAQGLTDAAGSTVQNVVIGSIANLSSATSGNVVIGYSASCSATLGGGNSVVIGLGSQGGSINDAGGGNNVVVGSGATIPTGAGAIGPSVILGAGAGKTLPVGTGRLLVVETNPSGGAQSALLYGSFSTGNLILGNSLDGTNRDFGGVAGTNMVKLLNGTPSSGATVTHGGYFYVTAGVLNWSDQNGIVSQLSQTAAGELDGSATVPYTNNAAAQAATMLNGPTAGNPTKWIPINDNGTIRNIPAW